MPVINLNEKVPIKEEKIDEKVEKETKQALEQSEEEVQEDTEEVTEPNKTEVASKQGWVPEDKYEGEPGTWVDAEEFLARGPLYKTIHKLNRKIKKMEETLEAAQGHYSKVEERARQEAIAELQAELKEASEEKDIEKALDVKDKIVRLETEEKPTSKKVDNPEFDEWVEENPWYDETKPEFDEDLRDAATGIGVAINHKHPDWTREEVYAETTKRIKKKFPESFSKGTNKVTTAVTTTTRRVASNKTNKKAPSYKQLPEDARINYKRLVKSERNPHGIMTGEKFFKDYLASGGQLEIEE